MERWVGWGIITANLVTLARTEASRHRTPAATAA
jgi:hypothetical protein